MTLHILWAHGARCLLVAQGFLGTTASGHDGSIFQLSPKSLGRVSGNICGVIKSSFLSSLKFPHKPQVCPDKEYHECIVNSSSNDLKIKCYLQQSGNRSKTQRDIFNKNWSYLGAHHKERATAACSCHGVSTNRSTVSLNLPWLRPHGSLSDQSWNTNLIFYWRYHLAGRLIRHVHTWGRHFFLVNARLCRSELMYFAEKKGVKMRDIVSVWELNPPSDGLLS